MTIPEADTEVGSLLRRDWIAGLEKGLSIIEAFDDQYVRAQTGYGAASASKH